MSEEMDRAVCVWLSIFCWLMVLYMGGRWVLTGYILPVHAPGVLFGIMAAVGYAASMRLAIYHGRKR